MAGRGDPPSLIRNTCWGSAAPEIHRLPGRGERGWRCSLGVGQVLAVQNGNVFGTTPEERRETHVATRCRRRTRLVYLCPLPPELRQVPTFSSFLRSQHVLRSTRWKVRWTENGFRPDPVPKADANHVHDIVNFRPKKMTEKMTEGKGKKKETFEKDIRTSKKIILGKRKKIG